MRAWFGNETTQYYWFPGRGPVNMSSTGCSGQDDSRKKVLKKLRRKQGLFLSQEPDANVSFIEGPSRHVLSGMEESTMLSVEMSSTSCSQRLMQRTIQQ